MLSISDLHVSVENKEILKGVNLHIPKNEVHALFGPNGSGKSVLLSTIMGFPEYKILQGKIMFKGEDINQLSIDERVKLGIAISEQRPPTISGVKLRSLIELLASERKDDAFIEDMVERFNMAKFLNRNINDGLSGGEIKKSELFLAMVARPAFLVLDEPDSGVDPEHLKKIGAMINEIIQQGNQGKISCDPLAKNSGLIATHSAAILNYIHTDKAHVMLNGQIRCSGNPGVMMEQIRLNGYKYCIRCQQLIQEE
ncbi:ABC transporter ATP-binding protein [Marinilabiliaceae bacterium JC017]|nr:ABC transporter ATP-binding protein [Marinilabiliaceae bacterium JC017]